MAQHAREREEEAKRKKEQEEQELLKNQAEIVKDEDIVDNDDEQMMEHLTKRHFEAEDHMTEAHVHPEQEEHHEMHPHGKLKDD